MCRPFGASGASQGALVLACFAGSGMKLQRAALGCYIAPLRGFDRELVAEGRELKAES